MASGLDCGGGMTFSTVPEEAAGRLVIDHQVVVETTPTQMLITKITFTRFMGVLEEC
jgi:hypothetical protein